MELIEISGIEYSQIIKGKCSVFSSYEFLNLNKYKVEKVRYFLAKNTKKRFALAVGEKDNIWLSPFSAPFSEIIEVQNETPIKYYWDFLKSLSNKAKLEGIKKITFFLPPEIYTQKSKCKLENALYGNGYNLEFIDVNYAFNLKNINLNEYSDNIHRNARKNLRISHNSGLELIYCQNNEEKEQAYEVIRQNRENKGYPLRMSLEQVMDTIQIVNHDFFLVKKDDINIASAIIYRVKDMIAQVVYWGNIALVGQYKPINFLAYELIKFYKQQGFNYLDIGPSTEEGVPNYGLCDFKESIGCEWTSKIKWSKHIC